MASLHCARVPGPCKTPDPCRPKSHYLNPLSVYMLFGLWLAAAGPILIHGAIISRPEAYSHHHLPVLTTCFPARDRPCAFTAATRDPRPTHPVQSCVHDGERICPTVSNTRIGLHASPFSWRVGLVRVLLPESSQ